MRKLRLNYLSKLVKLQFRSNCICQNKIQLRWVSLGLWLPLLQKSLNKTRKIPKKMLRKEPRSDKLLVLHVFKIYVFFLN